MNSLPTSMFNSVFKSGIYAHYTVASTPTFSNSPWQVYSAKSIKTKQQVSLFKFDKKLFEQMIQQAASKSFQSMSRSTYKMVLAETTEYVRNYVNNLIKFKHPNILSVIEPLEERQNSMIFVTECVTDDLNGFMKRGKPDMGNELLLANGLSQVVNAVEFLHNNANTVHLSITPSNIFLTDKLDFKLSGFNFIQKPDANYSFILPDERYPKFLSLNFDYSDPSLLLDNRLSVQNDVFSLGCLLIVAFSGKKLISCENDIGDYKAQVKRFSKKFKLKDTYLQENIGRFIELDASSRITVSEFKSSVFFNNELLNSLDFINNFDSKSLVEKNVFLKGFHGRDFFDRFPKFLLTDKFLPILKELLTNVQNLVIFPITLTCILRIAQDVSNLTFATLLLDVFKPLMIKSNKKNVELNILSFTEIQIIVLDNLKTILSKISNTTGANFKKIEKHFLMPFINNVLNDGAISIAQLQTEANSNAVQNTFNTIKTLGQISPEKLKIQEKFLSNLSLIISTMQDKNNSSNSSSKFVENEIFPKVSTLFKQTQSLTVRSEVLRNFVIIIKDRVVSANFVYKKIIPLCIAIKQKNHSVILDRLLELYSLFKEEDLFDKEFLVATVMPELFKLAYSNNELTIEKFNKYCALIQQLSNKLKERHSQYLEKYNEKNIIKNNSSLTDTAVSDSPIGSPVEMNQISSFDSIVNAGKSTPVVPSKALPQVPATTSSPPAETPSSMSSSQFSSGPATTAAPEDLFNIDFTPLQSRNASASVPDFNSILVPSNKKMTSNVTSSTILQPQNKPSLDWSSAKNSISSSPLSSNPNSRSNSRLPSSTFENVASFQSAPVLTPKKSSNLPPGFSDNILKPSEKSEPSQFKTASDNFFDSFI